MPPKQNPQLKQKVDYKKVNAKFASILLAKKMITPQELAKVKKLSVSKQFYRLMLYNALHIQIKAGRLKASDRQKYLKLKQGVGLATIFTDRDRMMYSALLLSEKRISKTKANQLANKNTSPLKAMRDITDLSNVSVLIREQVRLGIVTKAGEIKETESQSVKGANYKLVGYHVNQIKLKNKEITPTQAKKIPTAKQIDAWFKNQKSLAKFKAYAVKNKLFSAKEASAIKTYAQLRYGFAIALLKKSLKLKNVALDEFNKQRTITDKWLYLRMRLIAINGIKILLKQGRITKAMAQKYSYNKTVAEVYDELNKNYMSDYIPDRVKDLIT